MKIRFVTYGLVQYSRIFAVLWCSGEKRLGVQYLVPDWRRIEGAGKEAHAGIPSPLTSVSLHIPTVHWALRNCSCRWNNLPRIPTCFLRKKSPSG